MGWGKGSRRRSLHSITTAIVLNRASRDAARMEPKSRGEATSTGDGARDPEGEPRPARPWDLFDEEIGRVTAEVAAARLALCKGCDRYFALMHLCAECGCVMDAKARLPNAYCPLHKWNTAEKAPPEDG